MGVSNPVAKMTIRASNATDPLMHVLASANTSALFVRQDGFVGLGTTQPVSRLDVRGTVKADAGLFGTLSATTLNIGAGRLFVNKAGNIGIGTLSPSANLHIFKTFTSNPSQAYTAERVELVIGTDAGLNTLRYDKNFTGLDLAVQSAPGSIVGTNTFASTVTGVSVNMTVVS